MWVLVSLCRLVCLHRFQLSSWLPIYPHWLHCPPSFPHQLSFPAPGLVNLQQLQAQHQMPQRLPQQFLKCYGLIFTVNPLFYIMQNISEFFFFYHILNDMFILVEYSSSSLQGYDAAGKFLEIFTCPKKSMPQYLDIERQAYHISLEVVFFPHNLKTLLIIFQFQIFL